MPDRPAIFPFDTDRSEWVRECWVRMRLGSLLCLGALLWAVLGAELCSKAGDVVGCYARYPQSLPYLTDPAYAGAKELRLSGHFHWIKCSKIPSSLDLISFQLDSRESSIQAVCNLSTCLPSRIEPPITCQGSIAIDSEFYCDRVLNYMSDLIRA